MGCDMHLTLEAQTKDGWWLAIPCTAVWGRHRTGPFDLDAYHANPLNRAKSRNYDLFSILSDVRSEKSRSHDILMESGLPRGWFGLDRQ
jgi:hypothetical protein